MQCKIKREECFVPFFNIMGNLSEKLKFSIIIYIFEFACYNDKEYEISSY